MSSMHGQYFKSYKWKNRLVVVLSNDVNSTIFNEQLKILESDKEGMIERKLRIFKILPYHNTEIQTNDNFIVNEAIYNYYMDENNKFKVIVIGLDGNVKLGQNNLLSRERLYNLIDSMPMRQAEMNKN